MTLIDYEKSNVAIRRFCEADAEEVADLVIRNFKEVNSKDYSQNAIRKLVKTFFGLLSRFINTISDHKKT